MRWAWKMAWRRLQMASCRLDTHQRLVALHQLHNLDGLLVLVHFDRSIRQMRVKVLLGNGIVGEQQVLENIYIFIYL